MIISNFLNVRNSANTNLTNAGQQSYNDITQKILLPKNNFWLEKIDLN
jgi:hypothetical protein